MSTFENGWICRECWSANREVDDRCYRCHVDRPLGAPVTTGKTANEPQVAAEVEAKAAPDRVAAAVEQLPSTTQPRTGRFCLRCGAAWLPGAGFCTQCGTAVAEAASAEAEPEHAGAFAAARGRQGIRRPQVTVPSLDPRAAFERARSRFLEYHAAHERRWEAVMSLLAIFSFAVAILGSRVNGILRGGLMALALAVTIVFVAEYALRLLVERDRRVFALGHLLELAALVPWLRPLRIGRYVWIVWARTAFARLRGWRIRQPLAPPNGRRARLAILWFVLLGVTGVAAIGYSTGSAAGNEARFALLVMLLCVFSGLTAALATAFAGSTINVSDVPERVQVLEDLKAANLITAAEYELHRAALLQLLSPAQNAGMSAAARTAHVAQTGDRATHATGAT